MSVPPSDQFTTTPQNGREFTVVNAIMGAEIREFRRRFPGLPDPAYPLSERARVLLAARAAITALASDEEQHG